MNVRSELLAALADADGGYISGAALAGKLGISRTAVWKAVKSLEADGFSITSVTSKGYRLNECSNRLSAELIQPFLTTKTLGRNLTVYESLESTNSTAKSLDSADAPHGTAIVANRQTAGRGRIGRSFVSPAGTGLYMSVLVRPDFSIELAPMITAAAACAVAEAIEHFCTAEIMIKWVNDLYLNGKKICGILTEAAFGMELRTLDSVIIGIGVNVRSIADFFDDELKMRASSIEDETGIIIDRNRLCAEILNRLEVYMGRIGDRSFLGEYRRREYLTGNRVTANVGNNSIVGNAIGIDDSANLIIRTDSGDVLHLSSGEANLCRIVQ